MQDSFLPSFYSNLISTAVSFTVIFLIYLITKFLVLRKIEDVRKKKNFRIRAFYVVAVVFLFIMAHVWVNGFTHLLAVLGLVSAGLVVTNKEFIMNLVGWLVITWRGLFAEEDLIQIQQYKGYVKRIGVLYITLHEVSDNSSNLTGRVIRVPNGLTANNALINFLQPTHLLIQQVSVDVPSDNDFDYLHAQVKQCVDDVLNQTIGASKDHFGRRDKVFFGRSRFDTKVLLAPKADNLSMVQMIVRFYCASGDVETVREQILTALLKLAKSDSQLKMMK